jgi:PAS domain S-box-containing protein
MNDQDSTKRDSLEAKLQQMEHELSKTNKEKARLEATLAAIGDGVRIMDIDFKILYQNQVDKDIVGDHAGKHCHKAFQRRDQVCEGCHLSLCFQDGKIHKKDQMLMMAKGKKYNEITASPLRDSTGTIIAAIEIVRDVTERYKMEEAQRENEEMYRTLFEEALNPILMVDENGQYLGANKKALEFLECDRDELLRRHVRDFTPPALVDRQQQAHAPFVNYRANETEYLVRGTVKTLLLNAVPMHVKDKTILYAIGQDITERKRAEDKLRRSEQFIRNILDTVDEGFIVVDRDYRILTANNAFCSQVSLPCNEVIGRHCHEVSHRTSRPCHEEGEDCAVRHVFATGEPHAALHRHTDQEGHVLYVETKAFPVKDAAGYVTSAIETINNITEKHLLEEERLKTQKLESIGTLAGGIAHDFNNLLQGIFGYISMAKMTIDHRDNALSMLEQAENALQRSVSLTSQLLTFAKGGKPVKKLTDLRPVIENAAKFTLSGSRSDFSMQIPEDLWQAEADEGQFGQVIQNIVLNADQAMPIGGSVIITAKNVAEGDSSLPPGLARGNHIRISIQDTGIGIPQQYINKIFDPYFTTKEKGSGLGLATSYSIIRNHGGMIDIKTKPGEGSTFMIYLPAIAGESRTASAASPAEPVLTRTARVLVMDDEEIIRNISSQLLRRLGHDVNVAKHGQEALEKYQGAITAGKPFDIVILDLTVRGGMGGADTVLKLLEIDPAVKAIVSSGYSDDASMANYLSRGFKAYLNKPYTIVQLRNTLRSLLT